MALLLWNRGTDRFAELSVTVVTLGLVAGAAAVFGL